MRSPSIVFMAAFLAMAFQTQTRASAAIQGVAATHEAADAVTAAPSDNSINAPVAVTTTVDEDASSVPAQQSKAQTQTPKPSKPKPSSDSDRPPIEGSMVGYIDDAIVGSEVRFRFDAGFSNNSPDRAEFFYAQCGCDGPGAHGPGPGLALNLNFQQLYMRGEYAPIKRLSFLVEVPIRWIEPLTFDPNTVPPGQKPFGNQSGLSDLQAGFKFALLAKPQQYLTFQFIASFPSGDSSKGLGTAHYSVAPSILYFQKMTNRLSLEAQVGDTHPISSSGQMDFAGDVFTYGFGPSYVLYQGESVRFAPVVELVGWHVLGGLANNDDALINSGYTDPFVNVSGTNIVNLKVGGRLSIGNHNSFYAGFGQALTHEVWYRHILRVEYRYTF